MVTEIYIVSDSDSSFNDSNFCNEYGIIKVSIWFCCYQWENESSYNRGYSMRIIKNELLTKALNKW